MQPKDLPQAEKFAARKRRRRIWQKAVTCMACVVVFCTVYALILPAITLEPEPVCGLEAHIHDETCYADVPAVYEQQLSCLTASLIHQHTADCYDETGELICGQADYVIHYHDSTCYDAAGNLVCPLPVVAEHVHTEECYSSPAGHTHTEDCYALQETLICGLEESEGHIHEERCYDETGALVCELEEGAGHVHSSDCYTEEMVLICGLEESEGSEPELICELEEVIPHIHESSCYDPAGNLICGRLETRVHQHEESCMTEVEVSPAQTVLTCGLPEHVHTESCYPAQEPEPDPIEEEPEEEVPADEETDDEIPTFFSAEDEAEVAAESTEPITVDPYITGAKLFYREDSTGTWAEVGADATIPGTAELKLEVSFGNIPLNSLQANGGLLQCQLPALLRNPTADGTMLDEKGERIGTVTVTNGILTIDFDDTWLTQQAADGVTLINGSFYVTSLVNLSEIGEDGETTLVLGSVVITAHFEEDIVAKNGTVTLSKTVSPQIIETPDGDYAEYTLTVTAGEDGCPRVKVVDHFTANGNYTSYLGVSASALVLTSSGSPGETIATGKTHGSAYLDSEGNLIWEIGDMSANETRTLRYQVKLEEGYTFIQSSDSKLISNEAQAYAGDYPKDISTADLEPKAGLSLKKSGSSPVRNEDGSYTITYTITGEAYKSNMFTLKTVRIDDTLSDPGKPTQENVLNYISYVNGSFLLYAGNSATGEAQSLSPAFREDGKSFTVTLGNLAPGEAFCIQYQVRVEQEALMAADGEQLNINNRATAFADNAKLEDQDYLGTSEQTKYLKYSHWAKKLVGEALAGDVSISISGNIFDATGTELVCESNPPESFTAPSGSYLYTVLVNELGDWDVTSASMTDRIDGAYMQFVGYVKVEALDTDNGNAVVQTLWVKVDGNTSFNFTMAQLGLTSNQYAYRLSYYAEPKTIDGTAAVIVKNSFTLSGTIIPGTGDPFTLTGVTVSKDVILKGGNTITAEKSSWYYEGPTSSVGNYSNGTLYWVIQVSGDAVRAGTYIQDYLQTGSHYSHIRADSFVGVYTSALSSSELTKYNDIESALNSGQLIPVDNSYYSVETVIGAKTQDTSSVTVKMEATLPLDGMSMYIIIKTAPAFLPPHPWFGNPLYYYNYLRTSDDGQNWTERGRAYDILYEGTNIWKKVGAVFKFNGETIQETTSGSTGTIVTSELGEPGMFVSWDITVNYAGDLSGRYRLVDTLPDGMELAYVRLQQRGSNAKSTGVAQITGLGGDYLEYSTTAKPQGESAEITTYYYTDGDTILWDVDNLVAGKAVNSYAVTFQVVCRITDPSILLGGETKEFKNQVTLYGEDGRQRDIDTQTVSVTTETLKKAVEQGGRTLPFTIAVNPLGEDLLEGADKLTVVDTLSDTLKLDPTSIAVVNSNTQAAVPFNASVEGNTLRVTIPDSQPLTISYKAQVLAMPGEAVKIKNDAHWEGYASTDGGSVEISEYSYTVGGTASGSATPYVEIIKYDSSSVSTYLSGAEFEMVEGTMENGVFTPTAGKIWTGTTDANGKLKFGEDPLMAYNTVYRITETTAPKGFVLDSRPIYFLVAKANSDGTYPTYPGSVDVWYENGTYECRVGNGRGTAAVTKQFEDLGKTVEQVNGSYRFGIYDTENPVGNPMQTVSITFSAGQTAQNIAKFSNLELGKTYYIYELDDNGMPIHDGTTATVDGKRFTVSYPNGSAVTIAEDGSELTVTVTNSVSYPELPETGGSGTSLYTTGGLALILGAVMLLLYIHFKRRKEASASS